MELVNEFTVPRPIERTWEVLTDVELIAPCLPGAQLTEVEGDIYRGLVKVKVGPILAKFGGQARFVELDHANHRAVLDARGKEATGKGLASATVTAQLHDEGENTRVHVTTDLTISGKIAQFGRGALADISGRLISQFAEELEKTVLASDSAVDTAADAGTATGTATGTAGTAGTANGSASSAGVAAASDPTVEQTGAAAPVAADPATPAASGPAAAATDTSGKDGAVDMTAGAMTEPAAAPAATAGSTRPATDRPGVRVIEGPEAAPVDLLRSAGAPILKLILPVVLLVAVVVVVLVLVLR